MVGAGVFAVFGPAARAAGAGLLVGLVIAAVIAYCNAIASASLAAVYPTSGGTYIYGRERLGPWWGFVAGWAFVVGKTASCAAMALTFATYAVPGPEWLRRAVAVAAVIGLAAVNYRGVTRTAALAKVLVTASLVALAVLVVAITVTGATTADNLRWDGHDGVYGVLQAAGLLFFAFAGYARVATLGEEVRDPRRTIPRAILIALSITVVVYIAVGVTALLAAGPQDLAAATAPLVAAAEAAGVGGLAPVVGVGAALASLGALLALLTGVGRTCLAMSRHRDLPAWLSAVHPRYDVPHRAEVALAVVICAAVAVGDLREVIGFSSFGVLLYYAIANAAAFTLPSPGKRGVRALSVLGLLGCLTLAATLPWQSALTGVAVVAAGITGRLIILRRRGTAMRR
ncbi:APC family permease [Actinokineospora guangxiensis]|uniref:APC family permease n=1 Tax=Actinokineospora guangxiensis TaxID=1490288 RepID=A0ABW0EP74_9PSEU